MSATPATVQPPPVQQTTDQPLGEFFRYHGLWSPGVRLFRHLGFRAKAVWISLVFAIPIALLSFELYSTQAANIAFTQKERAGVSAMSRFADVYTGTLLARNAVRARLGGHEVGRDYDDARARTDKALAAMLAELQADGDLLALLPTVNKLKAAWDETASVPGGADAKGRTVFGPVAAAGAELLALIGDESGLVLDPDLDSFYLINAMVLTMPTALENVGQVWGWGSFAAAKGGVGASNLAKWNVWSARVASGAEDLQRYVQRAEKANPALKGKVPDAPMKAALALAHSLDGVASGAAQRPSAEVYAEGKKVLLDAAGLYGIALPALDGLLVEREAKLKRTLMVDFGVTALSLLVVGYLFMCFRKVLDGGLREVAFHIGAMRNGDLTTRPRPWGRDEAAALMQSLMEMQDSMRRLVNQVRGASDNIVHSSSEIASGVVDLSNRTEQAAANLQQSASAMEEVSSTVRQTADNAREASGIACSNAQVAERGGRIIGTMVATMEDIQASSRKIGDIIGTIDGIAFQTNILALNAAVEAARAGDAGRGFAVVASEVRQLAQRSASAAREIKGLISASVDKVESGTNVVREAGSTIGEIVTQAKRVDELLAEIATGAKEQASGVSQTSASVQQLDAATQQNAALVEQTAAAAASMKDQAVALAAEVGKFKLP